MLVEGPSICTCGVEAGGPEGAIGSVRAVCALSRGRGCQSPGLMDGGEVVRCSADGTGFSPRRTSAPCFSSPTATLPRGPGSGCLRGAFGRFPPLHHWVRRNRASIRRGFFCRRSKVEGQRSKVGGGGTAAARPNLDRGGAGAGEGKVSTQWKAVSRGFPRNGNMFRGFFHTMEACFGHFSRQWKRVLRRVSTVWKMPGTARPAEARQDAAPPKSGRFPLRRCGGRKVSSSMAAVPD
jgi:hypothetical protein